VCNIVHYIYYRLQSLHTAKAFFYSLFSPLIEHNMLSSEKNQSGTTTTTTSTSILRNKKSDLKYSLEIYQYITKACNVRKSRILSIVQESAASTNTTINVCISHILLCHNISKCYSTLNKLTMLLLLLCHRKEN
jgi:hypothetical protein